MARGSSTEPTILSQDFWFGYDTALTKLISVSGVWHVGTLLRPTIFHLVCLIPGSVMHPDQSAGQWHIGPSFRPTIYCLACVGLLNIAETLKSVSGFMARGTWLGPTICCLVWMDLLNLCTFAWMGHAVSVGHASVKGSGIHLISYKSIYFFPQRSHQQNPLSTF